MFGNNHDMQYLLFILFKHDLYKNFYEKLKF